MNIVSDRMFIVHRSSFIVVAALMFALSAKGVPAFRWGGDAEGGAPFVEADPNDPSKVRGFDVEVAEQIARGLGRQPEFVQVTFTAIDQSVERGDFEIGMSGVEDTPPRRAAHAVTIPYFEFHEVLTVRGEDRNRIRSFADLRGKKVGTLAGTIAYERLLLAEREYGIIVVSYDDDVHPYTDVRQGRLDAVLLDNIIAARSERRVPGLYTQPVPVATGHYIGVLARNNAALRDRINEILKARMRDGTLEHIYRKWRIWDSYQPAFFAGVMGGLSGAPAPPQAGAPQNTTEGRSAAQNVAEGGGATQRTKTKLIISYIPSLLKASVVTIVLSCVSMALAVF